MIERTFISKGILPVVLIDVNVFIYTRMKYFWKLKVALFLRFPFSIYRLSFPEWKQKMICFFSIDRSFLKRNSIISMSLWIYLKKKRLQNIYTCTYVQHPVEMHHQPSTNEMQYLILCGNKMFIKSVQ